MAANLTIESMQRLASLQGGKCLSNEYWDESRPLKWMCAKGHTWQAAYNVVSRGAWCPACIKQQEKEEKENERRGKCLEKIRLLATEKGGKCLSNVYINTKTKLQFECAFGHKWMSSPGGIRHSHWCPKCAGKAKPSLEELREFAAGKKGNLLSKTYKNNFSLLKWSCEEGHIWKAAWSNVRYNETWCPYCYGNNAHSLEDVQRFAESKGGKCLSKTYRNNRQILLFECKQGHQWKASAHQVFTKSWCPYCIGKGKRTIKDMQVLIAPKGGKCLSTVYHGSKSKLKWQCDKGHIWESAPGNLVAGCYCPKCAIIKRREAREQNQRLAPSRR